MSESDQLLHEMEQLKASEARLRRDLKRLEELPAPCRSDRSWAEVEVRVERDRRKKAERECIRAREEWERTFDAIEDFVTILDTNRRVVRMNRTIREAFKCSAKDHTGVRCHELFYGKDRMCKNCPASKVLIDHQTHSAEFKNRRMGKVFWVTASPILNESGELIGLVHVTKDITERKKAEEDLKTAYEVMESRVKERTAELTIANARLHSEVAERRRTEKVLREREAELDFRSRNLEEVNTALRVLLKARENDQADLEERVLSNVKDLVRPYVEKLNGTQLDSEQIAYLEILESNLNDIVSPFSRKLSSKYFRLTPGEIRVAGLVKDGKTNKEIAHMLNVSTRTVAFHRENIRRKLDLKNSKANLRSHLMAFV